MTFVLGFNNLRDEYQRRSSLMSYLYYDEDVVGGSDILARALTSGIRPSSIVVVTNVAHSTEAVKTISQSGYRPVQLLSHKKYILFVEKESGRSAKSAD